MSTIRRRRAEFSVILVLAASAVAWGQPPGGGQPESGKKKPAVPPNVVIERDVRYGDADDDPLLLDIVRPKEPSEQPRPVIAFIHGGAWSGGSKEIMVGPLVPFAASGDYFCVSIEYRLSGMATWPAQIHDCKAAIRWLKANARTYHIDPEKIGVWGSSAGGHLVSMLGVSADVPELEGDSGTPGVSSRVACVVDYCGPSDFMALARVKESKQQARLRSRVEAAGWSHRRESRGRPVGFAGQLRLEARRAHPDRSRHQRHHRAAGTGRPALRRVETGGRRCHVHQDPGRHAFRPTQRRPGIAAACARVFRQAPAWAGRAGLRRADPVPAADVGPGRGAQRHGPCAPAAAARGHQRRRAKGTGPAVRLPSNLAQ